MVARSRPRILRRLVVFLLVLLLLPTAIILILRWVPPPTSAFIIGNAIDRWDAESPCRQFFYGWTPWSEISGWAGISVVAAEDQLFPYHYGFDLGSIRKVLREHDPGEPMRGASTISQQVAKNLFLWESHNWLRKGIEAYLTLWIELLWPKRRILEVYLNLAQFGPCTFGVTAAAEELFGTTPAELTLSQAALLAAVLPDPFDMHAGNPGPYTRRRAAWVRRQVRQLGGPEYLIQPPPTPPGSEQQ